MSYRKHLNDKFYGNELTVSKSLSFFISPEIAKIIAKS